MNIRELVESRLFGEDVFEKSVAVKLGIETGHRWVFDGDSIVVDTDVKQSKKAYDGLYDPYLNVIVPKEDNGNWVIQSNKYAPRTLSDFTEVVRVLKTDYKDYFA